MNPEQPPVHVVVHDYPALNRGGIENMACSIAYALRAQGANVAVAGSGPVLEESFSAHPEIEQIPLSSPIRGKWFTDPKVARLLLGLNRRYGSRLILHLLIFRNVKVYRWIKPLVRGHCVSYLHGNDVIRYVRKKPMTFVRNVASCDLVVCNSAYTKSWVDRTGAFPNVRMMHPRINVPRECPDRHQSRRRFELDESELVLVIVGRLVWRKAHQAAIEAFARLRPRFPHLRLLIAGDGPLRNAIQEDLRRLNLTPAARVLGPVDEEAKWELFSAADFALMPSLLDEKGNQAEGFGIANLEAAAMGAVPVGTAAGGIPEALDFGRAGILLPACNEQALPGVIAEGLEKYLLDLNLIREMRRYARARAVREFGWAPYATSLLIACDHFGSNSPFSDRRHLSDCAYRKSKVRFLGD